MKTFLFGAILLTSTAIFALDWTTSPLRASVELQGYLGTFYDMFKSSNQSPTIDNFDNIENQFPDGPTCEVAYNYSKKQELKYKTFPISIKKVNRVINGENVTKLIPYFSNERDDSLEEFNEVQMYELGSQLVIENIVNRDARWKVTIRKYNDNLAYFEGKSKALKDGKWVEYIPAYGECIGLIND